MPRHVLHTSTYRRCIGAGTHQYSTLGAANAGLTRLWPQTVDSVYAHAMQTSEGSSPAFKISDVGALRFWNKCGAILEKKDGELNLLRTQVDEDVVSNC